MVTCPGDGDAVGGALRNVFSRDRVLPTEMVMLLAQLDRPTDRG